MDCKAIIFDIGGVLLEGGEPMAGAIEAVAQVRAAGLPVCLLTNTTSEDKSALLGALQKVDAEIAADDIITPADGARRWLQQHGYAAWPLVVDALKPAFEGLAGERGEAVVMGDIGERFDYELLNQAFQRLQAGAPLLALGKTRYFKRDGELHLDSGPFVHALEYAAGVEAIICGKPDARVFDTAAAQLGVAASDCCMIGDDVVSDVRAALDAGLQARLVRTGKYQPEDEGDGEVLACGDVLSAVRALLA